MDIIIEIFLRGIIANFFGLYTRYYFFKLIGKPKSIKYLQGRESKDVDTISHHVINVCLGIVVFAIITIPLVYFYFGVLYPDS
jgi:hypothetical protein